MLCFVLRLSGILMVLGVRRLSVSSPADSQVKSVTSAVPNLPWASRIHVLQLPVIFLELSKNSRLNQW